MGGLAVARRVGRANVLTLDMGGTSADISVIVDGRPTVRSEWHAQFNVPIIFPAIDLVTIGAGGGTVAWVDAAGVPHSGPESAGADPGPACYQRGGDRPTNTDANVVLNRLRPVAFMRGIEGGITIDPEAAAAAIDKHVATTLGTSVVEAAAGALRLSNASMINAIRLMTVERGYDPRDFALVAFGGAGPLHAADLAAELRVPEVIIPTYPGLVSAMGALQIDLRHDFVRPIFQRASALDSSVVESARVAIEAEIEEIRAQESVDEWSVEWRADLRYYGKVSGGLTLSMPDGPGELGSPQQAARYHEEHRREFGYAMTAAVTEVEIVNLRATLHGRIAAPDLPSRGQSRGARSPDVDEAYFLGGEGFRSTSFVDRDALASGDSFEGPAIVEQWDSTIVVPPGARARVTAGGEITLELGAAE
jgi:N-methylhydantoinase A